LFVAPILSGSGVKMKVLEAMSHGVPCVLSSHAAEGLNLPEIIPVCANKETFIEQVSLLLQNPDLCEQIGKAGQEFILKNYNSVAVSEKIIKLLRK
ncbi:glycosyltransferase, partial [Crocinitomicaceae bacterium]|nr:glycosyltransferase [Crocinitomicaceae bacterium]